MPNVSRYTSQRGTRRHRTLLSVPMLKEDELIGAINDLSPGGSPIYRKAD